MEIGFKDELKQIRLSLLLRQIGMQSLLFFPCYEANTLMMKKDTFSF